MFIDFYALLEVPQNVSQEEIKSAYRKQSIKWHPDKNNGIDTTQRMQDINQAYLILKDHEARKRYDIEYFKFKAQIKNNHAEFTDTTDEDNSSVKKESKQNEYTYSNYNFDDKILEKWMENAKKQARQMAKDAFDELKGGSQQAGRSIGSYFLKVMIPMLLGYLIIKACIN